MRTKYLPLLERQQKPSNRRETHPGDQRQLIRKIKRRLGDGSKVMEEVDLLGDRLAR